MAFLKYGVISVSVFLVALGLRYIPYIPPVQEWLPLPPEAFDRLGEAPTKNFDDNQAARAPLVISRDSVFGSIGAPSSEEDLRIGYGAGQVQNRFFGNFDFPGSYESPTKEFEIPPDGTVEPLPTPKLALPPSPSDGNESTRPIYVGIPQPNPIVQVVERIVERVVIREVEKPVPSTSPAPVVKPAPSPAPQNPSDAFAAACTIHTFENAAGGSSHTLIYRCEGFDQCSIAKNGETFVDVSGKGYFNFPGNPPSNYKIRCDDKSRVWSSSVTPFVAKPLFTQLAFRWFYNDDVEVGAEPAAEINRPVSYKEISKDRQIRLRLAVLAERAQVLKGEAKFKLQAALIKPAVSVSSNLLDYGSLCNQIPDPQFKDLSLFENLAFFNNPSIDDKALLAPSIEDPFYGLAIPQTYQESNSISNINAAIPKDTPAIWDISLRLRDISLNELICLRLVRQDNSLLDGYENWPAIYN